MPEWWRGIVYLKLKLGHPLYCLAFQRCELSSNKLQVPACMQLFVEKHYNNSAQPFASNASCPLNYTSSDPFLLVLYLDGSTETGLAAAGSIVAHFATLRAQKYMKRAFRICINFCPCSKFVGTRAQSKWLMLRAKYRVYWHFSGAKFCVGPRNANLQPYEAP